jgi:hypothetical protein
MTPDTTAAREKKYLFRAHTLEAILVQRVSNSVGVFDSL